MGETKLPLETDAKRIVGPALPNDGKPLPACRVSVEYVMDDPAQPVYSVTKGCSHADAAIAVSIIVTALIKAAAEAQEP